MLLNLFAGNVVHKEDVSGWCWGFKVKDDVW